MPWAASNSAWLRSMAGGRTRASWSTHTSAVMSCAPSAVERVAPPLVAGVGAQPARPAPVRRAPRWCSRSRGRRRGLRRRHRSSAGRSQAAGGVLDGDAGPGRRVGGQSRPARVLDRRRPPPAPPRTACRRRPGRPAPRASRSARRSSTRKARLSSSSLASTTTGPATGGQLGQADDERAAAGICRALDAVAVLDHGTEGEGRKGELSSMVAVTGPQRRPTARPARSAARRRRRASAVRTVRARVPAPGAGLDHHEGVGPAELVPPAVEGPARPRRRTAARPRGW